MYQRLLIRLLLTPSILSGLLVCIVVIGVLGYSGWLYISDNQIFYDYLFGAYGLKTFVWQNSIGFSAWSQAFLSSPLAYYLLLVAVAIAVGFLVFTLLQGAGLFVRGTAELLDQAQYKGPTHKVAMHDLVSRLVVRVTTLIGWTVYATFFVSSVMPFSIVLNQMGIEQLRQGGLLGLLACTVAVVVLFVCVHLHVIFLRLCALKPRLFGGDAAVEEVEAMSRSHIS